MGLFCEPTALPHADVESLKQGEHPPCPSMCLHKETGSKAANGYDLSVECIKEKQLNHQMMSGPGLRSDGGAEVVLRAKLM